MRKSIVALLAVSLCGCATVPEERRGQEVAAAAVLVAAGVGIVVARGLARGNAVQVQPRTRLGPP